MRIYSDSNVGKRRANNEDNFSITDLGNEIKLFVVADGVGGEDDGEVASFIATQTIKEFVMENVEYEKLSDNLYRMGLVISAINLANDLILQNQIETLSKMQTTVVAAMVYNDQLTIFNIGDSRCYLYDGELNLITKDHTYVQTLVDAGAITEEEARVHSERNYVTKVLGHTKDIEIDYFEVNWKENDILILCSDGLNSMVDDKDIKKIVENNIEDVEKIVKNLINSALKNGGLDNITVICAKNFEEQ